MAGFEVIVRPVVFPNIRPQPTRSLPPADDPEQGQAVFSGSSGQVIALTHSYSASASTSGGTEIHRTFDVARIYQMDDAGTVDKGTFIDVEVANKIKMRNQSSSSDWKYTPVEESENIEIIKRNQTRKS